LYILAYSSVSKGLSVIELDKSEEEVVDYSVGLLIHVIFPIKGRNHVVSFVGDNVEGYEI
jgi:hypothetical protein